MNPSDPTKSPVSPDEPLSDTVRFHDLPRHLPLLFPNEGRAPWLLRQRDVNGLAPIIHFVGRTAYVSKADFVAWFRSRPAQPTKAVTREPLNAALASSGRRNGGR